MITKQPQIYNVMTVGSMLPPCKQSITQFLFERKFQERLRSINRQKVVLLAFCFALFVTIPFFCAKGIFQNWISLLMKRHWCVKQGREGKGKETKKIYLCLPGAYTVLELEYVFKYKGCHTFFFCYITYKTGRVGQSADGEEFWLWRYLLIRLILSKVFKDETLCEGKKMGERCGLGEIP